MALLYFPLCDVLGRRFNRRMDPVSDSNSPPNSMESAESVPKNDAVLETDLEAHLEAADSKVPFFTD